MITKTFWGKSPKNEDVYLYTLTNASGASVTVCSFGARIVSILVPDRDGVLGDIIAGPKELEGFLPHGGSRGATIGRYGNRIADASFELDGTRYELTKNEHGRNILHGGTGVTGLNWDSAEDGEQVVMTCLLADGTDGFPGNMTIVSRYRWTEDNSLIMSLQAACDKPTVCNLTNHAYYNLGGPVADYVVQLNCDHYLTVDEYLIPTGVAAVEGTRFDFQNAKPLGDQFFDHQFLFSGALPQAEVMDPATGRCMTLRTDLPGTQMYICPVPGTNPPQQESMCLEPQFNPDSPHHAEWPSTILRPGEIWNHEICFTFHVK